MGGIAGQEDASHAPAVSDPDVMAVDHSAQYLDLVLGDALGVQDILNLCLPD